MPSSAVKQSGPKVPAPVQVRDVLLSKQGLLASIAVLLAVLCFWITSATALGDSLHDTLISVGTSLATVGVITAVARWLELERWRSREMTETLSNVIINEFGDSSGRRLGIELFTIDELAKFDLEQLANGAKTIYLVFLFEPALVGTNALTKWISSPEHKDRSLHVFLPDLEDGDFIRALAQRHQTSESELRRDIETVLNHFEQTRLQHSDRLFIRHVPSPGPTYSGYLFDPVSTTANVGQADISLWSEDRQRRRVIVRLYRQRMMKGEDRPTIVANEGRFWDLIYEDFQGLIALCDQPSRERRPQHQTFSTLGEAFNHVREHIKATVEPGHKALDVLAVNLFTVWRPHLQNWLYDEEETSLTGWTIRISALSRGPERAPSVPSQWFVDAEAPLKEIGVAAETPSVTSRNITLEAWGYDFFPAVHGIRFGNGDLLMAIMHPPSEDVNKELFLPNFVYELIPSTSDSPGSRFKRAVFEAWLVRSRQRHLRSEPDSMPKGVKSLPRAEPAVADPPAGRTAVAGAPADSSAPSQAEG